MKFKFSDIDKNQIIEYHNLCYEHLSWPSNGPNQYDVKDIWYWIERNHSYNCRLWDEEDKARRIDVNDIDIAKNKRTIDLFNQKRNDAIERIDEKILDRLSNIQLEEGAWFNSETAGSIIDRLSIVSLKVLHMGIQADRLDIDIENKEQSKRKKNQLNMQREDLSSCLNHLLKTAEKGKSFYKIYRQFKMYNDPKMNPYLSGLIIK